MNNFKIYDYDITVKGDNFTANNGKEYIVGEYVDKLTLMNLLKHNKEQLYTISSGDNVVAFTLKGKKLRYGIGTHKEHEMAKDYAIHSLNAQYECNCALGINLGCISTDDLLDHGDIIQYLKYKNIII